MNVINRVIKKLEITEQEIGELLKYYSELCKDYDDKLIGKYFCSYADYGVRATGKTLLFCDFCYHEFSLSRKGIASHLISHVAHAINLSSIKSLSIFQSLF